jgi:hypothetical protein
MRQFLLAPFDTSLTITGVSFLIRSGERKPKPCALTTSVSHSIRKSYVGSRLVTTTGICSDRRVLRLVAFLLLSKQHLPYLFGRFLQLHPCNESSSRFPSVAFHEPHRQVDGPLDNSSGKAGSSHRSAISWLGP